MATITKNQFGLRTFGQSPQAHGNVTGLHYNLTTTAAGAVSDSNSTTAVASGDQVRVGKLFSGMKLIDILIIISNAWSASVTGKVGFVYVDGVDDTTVPQNDAYFVPAGQSLATAATLRKTATTAPVVLPKDAWLVLTTGGAAAAEASITDFIVFTDPVGA